MSNAKQVADSVLADMPVIEEVVEKEPVVKEVVEKEPVVEEIPIPKPVKKAPAKKAPKMTPKKWLDTVGHDLMLKGFSKHTILARALKASGKEKISYKKEKTFDQKIDLIFK